MNDDPTIGDALRFGADAIDPLDPAVVVAGARRRRRTRRLATAGFTSLAVAAVTTGGIVALADRTAAPEVFVPPPLAGTPRPAAPSSGYVFQNEPVPVGSLAAGQRVKIGPSVYFQTRRTTWALLEPLPDGTLLATTGWRETVGNTNIGDGTIPGLQGSGSVYSSVFRSSAAHTVVYTHGNKAWYGKLYRLQGIPGWVQASADLTSIDEPGRVTAGADVTTPVPPVVGVFVYDARGELLVQFPQEARDPLGG